MASNPSLMPAMFFGHGSPMYALEHNRYTQTWRRLGDTLPRPKAILSVSTHWYTRDTSHPWMRRVPCTISADFRVNYLTSSTWRPATLCWLSARATCLRPKK